MSGTRAISTKSRSELSSRFFSCKARRRRKFTPFWEKHYLVSFLVGLRTYQHPCIMEHELFRLPTGKYLIVSPYRRMLGHTKTPIQWLLWICTPKRMWPVITANRLHVQLSWEHAHSSAMSPRSSKQTKIFLYILSVTLHVWGPR